MAPQSVPTFQKAPFKPLPPAILEMEIYIHGTSLFMIVETPLDFDWDTAMAKMATLPRQEEWENYMSVFQQAEPGASSAEKWQLMDRMFYLYE